MATVGVAALSALALTCVPQAHAADRNLVIFGDSVVANPTAGEAVNAKLGLDPRGSSGLNTWCPQSRTNWGRLAAAQLALIPYDYSCTGTTTISPSPKPFQGQIDRALREGALTPETARVIITVGFNDTYKYPAGAEGDVRRRFVGYMAPQVERIRAAAPNARIQFVGYPKITKDGKLCLVHVLPHASDWTPAPDAARWEDLAQWMSIDAARATGTEFLDLKPSTWNNSMCAPDDQRMWAGLIDFTGDTRMLPAHVNERGHRHVADVIAAS
ncbi:hydrolase [Corynebacterium liangguodongii]|uniref:Hydrolase n=1 Tax=Corynebacterium liangguodongii TaxID=2079535 RepID=A0A2S0WC32_9CORY|nr:hydrolase [Corynebacterium liangguodongii]PWC00668.1 SGNH/GDSL hydrolase family protein [Corynebacterium liangguodongii]